jgi:hypothetical protein
MRRGFLAETGMVYVLLWFHSTMKLIFVIEHLNNAGGYAKKEEKEQNISVVNQCVKM